MSKKYSYTLSTELMELLEQEYSISQLVAGYKETLESSEGTGTEDLDKDVFGTFGRNLANRLCELESNHRDRSAEVLYMIAEKTGHPFPSIQQRLLEMAYLATMNENRVQFQEVSFKRLAYEIGPCVMHQQLAEAINPEVAGKVPCRHLCMELCKGICEKTGVGNILEVHMPSAISDETKQCVFSAELTLEEQLRLSGR